MTEAFQFDFQLPLVEPEVGATLRALPGLTREQVRAAMTDMDWTKLLLVDGQRGVMDCRTPSSSLARVAELALFRFCDSLAPLEIRSS